MEQVRRGRRPWREIGLQKTISWTLMFGSAVAGLTAVLVATVDPAQLFAPSYLGMLLVFGGLLVLRFVRVPFRARAVGFVLVLLLVATLALLNFGVAPAPLLALALATIVAGTFLGRGALAVTAIAAPLAILVSGWVSTRGWVRPSNPTFAPTEWLDWVRAAFEYALAGGSVAALLLLIIYQLERHEIARARAERLEALGRLAGGVAHDFNNSLQVMFVWQELLASHDDETVREAMEEIGVAAEQASRLTAQLLAFGKRDLWAPVPLALGDEVERWAVAIRRVLPEDVRLEVSTEANPVVVCDPGQLEQILLNLVVNARDALGGAGRIEVSLETVDASELPDASVGARAHAAYAVMRVRDDGPGMSEEVRKRVFEPFFSTKEQLGTGLGLSIVHSAVQRAGGWTDVETELERGTTFSVYFPCEDDASVPLPAERRDEPLPAVEPGGVVLLAEDEAPIRRNLSTFLRAEGYRVLEAEDGDRAPRERGRRPVHRRRDAGDLDREPDRALSRAAPGGPGHRQLGSHRRGARPQAAHDRPAGAPSQALHPFAAPRAAPPLTFRRPGIRWRLLMRPRRGWRSAARPARRARRPWPAPRRSDRTRSATGPRRPSPGRP